MKTKILSFYFLMFLLCTVRAGTWSFNITTVATDWPGGGATAFAQLSFNNSSFNGGFAGDITGNGTYTSTYTKTDGATTAPCKVQIWYNGKTSMYDFGNIPPGNYSATINFSFLTGTNYVPTWYTNCAQLIVGNSGITPKSYSVQLYSNNIAFATDSLTVTPGGNSQNKYCLITTNNAAISYKLTLTSNTNYVWTGTNSDLSADAGSGLSFPTNILGGSQDYSNFNNGYNPGSTNLALDETLRRVGSVLHSDNAQLAKLATDNASTAHSDSSTLHGDMGTANGKLDTLHSDLGSAGTKLDTLHGDAGVIEGKLDTINSTATAQNANLGHLPAIDTGIQGLNAQGSNIAANLQSLLSQSASNDAVNIGALSNINASVGKLGSPIIVRVFNDGQDSIVPVVNIDGAGYLTGDRIWPGSSWGCELPATLTNKVLKVYEDVGGAFCTPSAGYVIQLGGLYVFNSPNAYHGNWRTNVLGNLQSINSNEVFFTNQLGQIYQWMQTNSDSGFWVQVTNQLREATNWLATINHTLSTQQTYFQFTNNVFLTNQVVITNNLDLSGVTNLLGVIASNTAPPTFTTDTDSRVAQGETAAQEGAAAIDDLISGVPTETIVNADPPADDLWKVHINTPLYSTVLNLNPMAYDWVQDLAALTTRLITWLVYASACWYIIKELGASLRAMVAAQPAQSDDNVPLVSILTALAIATAMTVAITLLIKFFATQILAWKSGFAINPFNGTTTTVVNNGIWLLKQFVPLGLIIQSTISLWVFKGLLSKAEFIRQTVIRFLVP